MTANAFVLFAKNKNDIKISDLDSASLKMALVASTWTPDATVTGNEKWGDISANEIAAANGYTAGGYGLTGAVAATAGSDGYKLSSGNATWTASGGSIAAFRYAVLYYSGTVWGIVNPALGYILCDNTPADVPATTTGNTLTITCPAAGWYDLI